MSNIRLLDCTLRDGGYINDWNFGFHTTRDIIRKLVDSQVDYVEIGFLRNCTYDKDHSLYNNWLFTINMTLQSWSHMMEKQLMPSG